MSTGTNLVVPVVLWGKTAPTHCISCIFLSRDQRTLVTGCYDGQICLWQVDPDTLKMTPRCLLVGHTAPVLCLSKASIVLDNNFIVSSSESGEMCTWDLVDGKCREVVKLPYVHTSIQAYHMCGCDDVRLFCNGYYAEVLVMDPFSLEIVFTLASRVNPDWISALHVLRPAKRKDDVVLALTTTGTVKVWTLFGQELKSSEPFYENESKQIRCLSALSMTCCAYNQRTVLIVCSKYWQIYDAGDFSVLCSVISPRGERWLGGDFLAADRVVVWSDEGRGYMYKLPANIADSKDFHSKSVENDNPFLYCLLAVPSDKPLSCPPAMRYHVVSRQNKMYKYLIRGDSEGCVLIWNIPEVTNSQLAQIKQEDFAKPPAMPPTVLTSLVKAWAEMKPPPVGILDQLDRGDQPGVRLTASIYLPQRSRLVVGREDGSIIIVPATQTVMLQLLHGKHQQYDDWPPHQLLLGHAGRVNCLLYPHHLHQRYEKSHLVSGGVDFAVCLWDLYSGTLLHRFCVHAGEITQLLVPPNSCSPRIQKCVCSVASDHSVTLLGLTERKCVVLASRHLFPVVTIKWRPLDDFMIVGCSDGTVYVWQMETGHLDRVLHGINAEEVLYACDENPAVSSSGDVGLANPAVHFFRGLRHRNLSAIRHATQRGLHQLQQFHHATNQDGSDQQKSQALPLMIQGLRTNPKDPESHILVFDIEALIVHLLTEEYSTMSPGTLEAQGLINQAEYQKVAALTQSASPDAHKKIADFFGRVKDKAGDLERTLKEKDRHGILAKMKEGAENVQTKLQARAEIVGFKPIQTDGKGNEVGDQGSRKVRGLETNATMEIAQLLLSLLHAWGMDPDLDRVCEGKLGLLRPMVPVSFGVLSKGGYMSLLLPTWQAKYADDLDAEKSVNTSGNAANSLEADLPVELVHLERLTRLFTARTHWELSTTLTSNHLLAIIALANTLMSMNNATFVPEQERTRKLHRQSTRTALSWATKAEEESEDLFTAQQAQIKQGWSLLATLHCVLLPDKVVQAGSKNFKRPQVEMMARRWQHQCLEVREAAQALLLAELGRLGPKGRKALVDSWAQFLPSYSSTDTLGFPPTTQHPSSQTLTVPSAQQGGAAQQIQSSGQQGSNGSAPGVQTEQPQHEDEDDEEEEGTEEYCVRKPWSVAELKRKQTTAVVLLGVIGAEFGQDVSEGSTRRRASEDQRRKSSVVEGFGIGNNNLARLTSLALTYLLLAPPSSRLPAHTPLRRAAIDLIGRGFTVWEPYLDVSKVLLGLLELCCEADKLVPSMTYGLPLTPAADSCRTARHALTLIATARPAAFITTMAREVARYNTLQQNAQALNVNLSNSVLHRAKPEILRGVELLIDKMQNEMADLLVEVVDIVLHCLDPGHLKTKGLGEVFPAVCRFNQVSHCPSTRRIAVGAKSGHVALYELRSQKCQVSLKYLQMIQAHGAAITANTFSPDGKYLSTYSCKENRLSFWQTSTGMFGLGNSQTRCIKSYSTAPIADLSRLNPMRLARLIWINNRTVSLMLADGSETRFNV
ncbi:WD repeat-containing protein 7 isoform X5 [Zootermopsis nevadensis]|uniref:WD repeat-containing protein 7 isoform X5 n=1 Tax=Zootermopsis nevadensis TaxID=136037 RepID=UPI000B8E34DF|nr:WD repeat-containing protein 7 isoform X5 [Zootermopsis nevadensis]